MRALFAPASALVGRLRFAQKFVVVGLVLLLPLGFVVRAYVDLQQAQIAFSARERIGVAYMLPLVALTAEVVQVRHRAVGGSSGQRVDLDDDIATIDELDRQHGELLGTTKQWRDTKFLLGLGRAASLSPRSAFGAYNRAIDSLLALIVQVGDQSNLTLDPELDTYYLMDTLQFRLPLLLDTSGRTVDRALVARRELDADPTPVLIELGLDSGALVSTLDAVARGMRTAVEAERGDGIARLTEDRLPAMELAHEALVDDVGQAVRRRDLAALAPYDATEPRDAVLALAEEVAGRLDRLLAERIVTLASNALRVQVAGLLASLLAVYLFIGFYLSVTTPVRRMVATLRAVAEGDYTRTVAVSTRDELGFIGTALNDTVEKVRVARSRLAHDATHDSLTELPNRALVLERLAEGQRRLAPGQLLALLFCDLDRFKLINDSMGHEAGDELLRTVAARLRAQVREGTTVARLAGDEFVVISEDLASVEAAVELAQRLSVAVSAPIVTAASGGAPRMVNVEVSVGIATVTAGSHVAPTDLIRDADVAMYAAKQRGGARVVVFDEPLRVAVQERLATQQDLRRAITEEQLRLVYQPIVDADSGATTSLEALVRWEHPERGLLAPQAFVPLAEETGLIVPLGAWVLRNACRQAAAWRAASPLTASTAISVNVSAHQLAEPSLLETVAQVLDETGLDPDALWLEITETALMADAEGARRTLVELRNLGVHLAIDDFGTGYSSLAYLRRFPVEVLKVDRSFVERLGTDAEDEAVVRLIVHLAGALGLSVVAEGVETAAQLHRLRHLGCDRVQGYLYSPPVSPATASTLLTAREPASAH